MLYGSHYIWVSFVKRYFAKDSIILGGCTYYPSRGEQRPSRDNSSAKYVKISSGLTLIALYDLPCCSMHVSYRQTCGHLPSHGERWATIEVLLFAVFLAVIFNLNRHCGWTQTAPTPPTPLLIKMCIPSQPPKST